MASLQRLVINYSSTAADFASMCNLAPLGPAAAQNLSNFLVGVSSGLMPSASIAAKVGAVQATATITSTGAATAAQTMTLANITLTAVGSAPAANEFVVSATVATQAANIAAAINASADLAGIVTATSALGVVTVSAVVPGLMGNGLQIVDVDLANVAVAAFSGGLDGTSYSISLP